MKLTLNREFGLYQGNNKVLCDSLQVAETFGKEHKNVLRDIENLDCSAEFNRLNFEQVKYKDGKGRMYPKVLMTKDGFTFLVMGYTGKKAAAFKEAYITRFNQMEQFIKTLATTRAEFPEFTSAIKQAHKTPHVFNFINEINLIYKIVIGKTAREYRESYNLPADEVIKPYLTLEQIKAVESLQRVDIGLIEAGLTFRQRKDKLSEYYNREFTQIAM